MVTAVDQGAAALDIVDAELVELDCVSWAAIWRGVEAQRVGTLEERFWPPPIPLP